jgi:TRAP transporter TAXI family solute receptor
MDSPYYRYGVAVADRIQADYPGTTANAQPTTGSAYNLESVRDPAGAKCVLSVVQFTTAVDARNGVLQFEGSAIEQVRSVGPVWFDLLQLVARQDSGIGAASDLCQSRIATGLPQSGTYQIGGVLLRQVARQASEHCQPELVPETLPDGLADLRNGNVAAVLWAGGSPTEEIRDAIAGGLAVRLLPLDSYIGGMQDEWDEFYGARLGPSFVPGSVYAVQSTSAGDYPGVPPTATVAVPNGLVVNKGADPRLVEFAVGTLFEHRGDLEGVLWDAGGEQRHFLTAQQSVGTNPIYCLVPLHPAALSYYQSIGVTPPCPPAVPPTVPPAS